MVAEGNPNNAHNKSEGEENAAENRINKPGGDTDCEYGKGVAAR